MTQGNVRAEYQNPPDTTPFLHPSTTHSTRTTNPFWNLEIPGNFGATIWPEEKEEVEEEVEVCWGTSPLSVYFHSLSLPPFLPTTSPSFYFFLFYLVTPSDSEHANMNCILCQIISHVKVNMIYPYPEFQTLRRILYPSIYPFVNMPDDVSIPAVVSVSVQRLP